MKKFMFLLAGAVLGLLGTATVWAGEYTLEKTVFYDQERGREVPVALYFPVAGNFADREVVIFSHGYGRNRGGDYLKYSYINEKLAAAGYFVVSVQHELPDDDLLPLTGNLQVERLPNWQRGAQNIGFVLGEIKRRYPELDYSRVSLMGHSNGGDMSALYTEQNADLVHKLITLDHRRYPLPRLMSPRIYSLRGSDYLADDGVLPDAEKQLELGMTIIYLNDIRHGDMDDDANAEQRQLINAYLLQFLKTEP